MTKEKWVEYFQYLDELRDSGRTNMFGAAPYLREEFEELDGPTASTIVVAWMKTYSDDETPAERVMKIDNV